MTTYTSFTPPPNVPFRFLATFDGIQCSVAVTWNVYRQGWYVNVYEGNTLIVSRARVGSPPASDISLTGGYFTSTLVYRQATNNFEVSP
jgi:hypothetical protein